MLNVLQPYLKSIDGYVPLGRDFGAAVSAPQPATQAPASPSPDNSLKPGV